MRIPVHVVGNIEVVVLVSVFVLEITSAVHHTDKTARIFHLGEPGSLAVEGHIRAAVGFVVDEARLAFAVQRRMRFPEGDCCFYKGGKLRIPGGCFPVDPAGFVVLAPGVVVALLAVAEFIAAVNQRCSLACHQHENGIFQLAEAQRAHSRFPGHAFCAAVPGQVFVGTIHIVFAIVQIVFLFVGNAVIQGKTVVIRKIIDHTVCLRASSQIIGEVGKAALIAF